MAWIWLRWLLLLCFPVYFCSSGVEVIHKNDYVAFVAILFELWRNLFSYILKNVMTKVFSSLQAGLYHRKQHFSPFSQKRRKKTKSSTQNKAITFHVVYFSAKYENIWEKDIAKLQISTVQQFNKKSGWLYFCREEK